MSFQTSTLSWKSKKSLVVLHFIFVNWLYVDPKYDLKAMLLDGRRDEISKFKSKEIKGKPDCRGETNQVTIKSRKCRNCGSSHSNTSLCPANHYCRKPNLFANVCRGKSKDSHKPQKPVKRKAAHAKHNKSIRPLTHSEAASKTMSICILFAVNRLLQS